MTDQQLSERRKLRERIASGKLSRRELLRIFGVTAAAFAAAPLSVLARSGYDYIVVGAGAAGCTLTARLLRDSHARILLIEAGGTNDLPEVKDFTLSYRLTQPGSPVDWAFKSEPQASLLDKPQSYSCGKLLGGSTSINGMVWVRGNRADYDRWALHGATGWDYASVAASLHALTGPIVPSSELTERNALSHAIVGAAVELGYPFNRNYNGRVQHGVGYTQLNVVNGIRQDAFSAFLGPFLGDSRLTIMTEATLTRLLFDRGTAIDRVCIDTGNGELQVSADREVILCTGTIQTPHLLQLSGVGDASELEPYGISVVADLPEVGKNLQDHLISVVVKKLRQPEPASHLSTMDVNVFTGVGPLGAPKFEVQSYYMRYGWGAYPPEALAFGVSNLHPTSRGYVSLRSADYRVAPKIQPNFLSTRKDLKHHLEGYKLIRELLNAEGLRDWLLEEEAVPGAAVQSDAQLVAAIRQYSEANFHPVGTCRMGTDEHAVVDSQLRVRKLRGLRLASAAVMPSIMSGNTGAPSMMIGDRCGRLILGQVLSRPLARERMKPPERDGLDIEAKSSATSAPSPLPHAIEQDLGAAVAG
jgi:choline dehydrogenase